MTSQKKQILVASTDLNGIQYFFKNTSNTINVCKTVLTFETGIFSLKNYILAP